MTRLKAVLEVLGVFGAVMVLVWALQVPGVAAAKQRLGPRPFLEYTLMMVVPLALLLARRARLSAYGARFDNLGYHLTVAMTCLIPQAVVNAVAFGALRLDARRWDGAVFHALLNVGLLVSYVWLLRNKAAPGERPGLAVAPAMVLALANPVAPAVTGLAFYALFLGPAEEFLFRGYMQSRLNQAFGRPFRVAGVSWGLGIVLTSLVFGLMHVLNGVNPFLGHFRPMWAWGFWTFFAGLALGFVRERTGSIVAPALLHGLPQAIASLFAGR